MKIRLVSLNVRYCNGQDGPHVWSNRLPLIARTLVELQPDLLTLQEVLPHQRKDLEERFPHFQWTGLGRNHDFSDEQCPVAVSERFELLGTTNFWLSDTPDKPGSKGWDACLPRLCTVAWIQAGGQRVVVGSTHFDHLGSRARAKSAELVRTILNEPNTLLAGDLNCSPKSEPVRILREDFKDTLDALPTPTPTFHDFGRQMHGPTIDYVFYKPEFQLDRFEVLQEDGPEYCSDHYALVADFSI